MEKYATVVLRVGLAFVFGWFSYSQFMDPGSWARLIPEAITGMTGLSAQTFVTINASAEAVAVVLLLLGLCTRWVAGLLFLHMLSVVTVLGLSASGVRDIGVATACLALALLGNGIWGLSKPKAQSQVIGQSIQ